MQLFSILEKNVRKKVIASRVLITCISHVIIIKLYHAMGLINLVVSTIIPIKVQLSFHSNLRDVLGLHRIIQTTKKRVLPAAALIATHTTTFSKVRNVVGVLHSCTIDQQIYKMCHKGTFLAKCTHILYSRSCLLCKRVLIAVKMLLAFCALLPKDNFC